MRDAWVGESLLYVLRERLGLMGSKGACEQGECGSCSVLVDGALVCSCLVLAASAVGQEIVTIEGVAPDGAPSDVQQAFVDAGAVQCGFCTPGLIMAAHALLERNAGADRVRDPRGAVRQRLPLHRLRPDHRGRPARVVVAPSDEAATGRDVVERDAPVRRRRAGGSATARSGPTASPRCRARSRSPATCRRTASCGARRCARRTRTPGSCRSTSPRPGRSTASRRSSPPRTCRASRPTG